MVTRAVLAYNLAYIKPRPRHAVGGALSDNGVCPSVCHPRNQLFQRVLRVLQEPSCRWRHNVSIVDARSHITIYR